MDLNDAGSDKGDGDGNHVDGELELEELCDAVVHVATPHHRFHDTREVVVRQNDVRRLLCHVRSSHALVCIGKTITIETGTKRRRLAPTS